MDVAELQAWTSSGSQFTLQPLTNAQRGATFADELGFSGTSLPLRNTIHFSLNCVVQDHAYGTFGKDICMVSPLVDTTKMHVPSSFSEVDVSFPFSEHGFSVAHPVVFAREGVDVPPHFPRVVRVQGNALLSDAIRDHFPNLPIQSAGLWSWNDGCDTHNTHLQQNQLLAALNCVRTSVLPHSSSNEGSCEIQLSAFLAAAHRLYCGNRWTTNDVQVDCLNADVMHKVLLRTQNLAQLATHPETSLYANRLLHQMNACYDKALEFDASLGVQVETPTLHFDRLVSLSPPSCRDALQSFLEKERVEFLRTSSFSLPPPLLNDDCGVTLRINPSWKPTPSCSSPLPTPHKMMPQFS
jgi:hypothetical protein